MGQYKCCCCIPVRAGVLIIALLTAALYIASTVGLFMLKPSGVTYENVEVDMKIVNGVYYTFIAVSIIFALTSLFGVLGSVTQHRKMIATFKVSYWFVAILQFIVTVAAIIILAVKRTDIVNNCALYPEETVDTCSVGYRTLMIIFCVVSIVISFIQFYFATAISAYATRLRRTNMHEKLRNLEDFPEPPSKTEFF